MRCWGLCVIGLVLAVPPTLFGQPSNAKPKAATPRIQRYWGQRWDQSLVTGHTLSWHAPGKPALLDERPLLDPPPVKWLIDRQAAPVAAASAWVEMHTGDRLPGQVVSHQAPAKKTESAALLVATTANVHQPFRDAEPISVALNSVRRIVWRPVAADYQPRTLWLRDGRSIGFRGLRWNQNGVEFLSATGRGSARWEELAEVHLAAPPDPWKLILDELRSLVNAPDRLLVQLESSSGLILTGSVADARPTSSGPQSRDLNWAVSLRPAWSGAPLWVRPLEVRQWRFFMASTVPLTRMRPTSAISRGLAAKGQRPWTINRSLCGAALAGAGPPVAWGVAVHGDSSLTFPAPPLPSTFVTDLALDAAAQGGGCLQGKIVLGGEPQQVLAAVLLAGKQRQATLGPLSVPAAAAPLTLRIEPSPPGAPADADPLDMRDFANWIEPRWELDPAALAELLQKPSGASREGEAPAEPRTTAPIATPSARREPRPPAPQR